MLSEGFSPQSPHAGETPALPGTLRIARMRARRPRTQGALAAADIDSASAHGTPAHPGGTWFSVIAGMVRDWCQAGSGLSYCGPPGPCHISGRETETTNSFATTSRRSARASARSLRRRARRPHPIQVHGCARLRRAYQQRLLQVRAPPARISAASAPGARASGAQTGETPALPGGAWFNHAAQRYKS